MYRKVIVGARRRAGPASKPRRISEELLREARRLTPAALTLRAVAETLLDQTTHASAHSAEVSLRFQFKRRGWHLHGRTVPFCQSEADST